MATKKSKAEACCPASKGSSLLGDEIEDVAALAKALGHSARVRILTLLIEKGVCITGDLADELPLAASTVSEHVRVLREAGLIKGTIDGPRRCYCVNLERLTHFRSLVTALCPTTKKG